MKVIQNFSLMDCVYIDLMWLYDMLSGLNLGLLFIVLSGFCIMYLITSFISMQLMMWLELMWTSLPTFILMFICCPSFMLLYNMESFGVSEVSVGIVGHQWYWTYYMNDFDINFDSFMKINPMLLLSDFRLLDVDNPLVLPFGISIDLTLTSMDVLHSWSLPNFGIKVDCIPNHITHSNLFSSHCGIYYGMCSEICGIGHSFMPIKVEFVSMNMFFNYMMIFE